MGLVAAVKYDLLPAVGTTVGRPSRVRVRDILNQHLGPGALRGHSRGAHVQAAEKPHPYLLPSSAALTSRICDRSRFEVMLKRSTFSASSFASRSRFTLLPSFFSVNPLTSTTSGLKPRTEFRSSL